MLILPRRAQFGPRRLFVTMSGCDFPSVVELNIGGVLYTTSLKTLTSHPDSQLHAIFTGREPITQDAKGRYFLDRDGVLFRYVLDFLRDGTVVLPECFRERERLRREAEKYLLPGLVEAISSESRSRGPGSITVGYFVRFVPVNVTYQKIRLNLTFCIVACCLTNHTQRKKLNQFLLLIMMIQNIFFLNVNSFLLRKHFENCYEIYKKCSSKLKKRFISLKFEQDLTFFLISIPFMFTKT